MRAATTQPRTAIRFVFTEPPEPFEREDDTESVQVASRSAPLSGGCARRRVPPMVAAHIVETQKKPGILYATTDEGHELAVVDITNPAFAVSLTPEEHETLTEQFLAEQRRLAAMPALLRNLFLGFFLRGSLLARGLRKANGSVLPGLETYLLKLGPENLPSALIKPIDRRVAAALPAFCVRLRLQDMARMLADLLAPQLEAAPGRPLHLIDVAGGPSMATLNTLLLLQRERPALLTRRSISVDVLDLDVHGPSFGRRALEQLRSAGAPLHGLEIQMRHLAYDWRRPADLRSILDKARANDPVLAGVSEGALFEYGTDAEILSNLEELRGIPLVGSVTRNDEPVHRMLASSGARLTLVPRGIDAFRTLVARVDRRVARVIERPFSDHVTLA